MTHSWICGWPWWTPLRTPTSTLWGPEMLSRACGLLPVSVSWLQSWGKVKAEHFRTTRPSKKLSDKNYSPYEILARPGTHSVTLWLPNHLCAVHPVFHLSQLEPETPNIIPNRIQPHPSLIKIEDELEYEISKILNSKIDPQQCCKLLYYVQWEGYQGTDEETLWLPATELDHAKELIADFHTQYPDKPGPLP